MSLSIGSLFAGVGGFDLGFERAGFKTIWQCEIDKAAQGVLRRWFPDAALHSDVRNVGAHNLEPVDVVTFGSPCQDLSVAGKRAGLAGGRSGLFHEAARVIRELRERYGKPDFAIWETSQVPSQAMTEETLQPSFRRWLTSGRVMSAGESWTRATSESPNVADECFLSQILEANAPSKYSLSPKACAGILRRAEKRGKKIPEVLERALRGVAQE